MRNASLLRNKIENLVVPLMCIVDYFGQRFVAMSPIPASINSLVYGSDTDGLVFRNDRGEAEQMAIQIAKVLNLRVVAEGVETRRQRRLLEDLGCDEIQGFLFSSPLGPAETSALLLKQSRTARATC